MTGGAGFVGGHLVRRLLAEGAAVTVLDDLSTGSQARLPMRCVRFVRGDIRDSHACARAVEDAEVVFHLAAVSSVPLSRQDPAHTWSVNRDGSLCLLQAAHRAQVRRVVCASSCAAAAPTSPYGMSKAAMEQLSAAHPVPTVALRYFNVYGPGQSADVPHPPVVAAFVQQALAGGRCAVHGGGQQSRDFVYIDDIITANLLAARAPESVCARVYDIGTGQSTTIAALLAQIDRLCGGVRGVPAPARIGELQHSRSDLRRASADLRYAPSHDLETGLRRTIDWQRRAARAAG